MNRLSKDNGFTLLELLMAVTVLSVGLIALAQLGVMAIQTNQTASAEAIATRLATNKIDALKKESFANLIPNNYVDPKNLLDSKENSGGIFLRRWTIASGPTTGTKKINVEVSWAGGAKKVALNSLVAKEEL